MIYYSTRIYFALLLNTTASSFVKFRASTIISAVNLGGVLREEYHVVERETDSISLCSPRRKQRYVSHTPYAWILLLSVLIV